MRIPNSERLSFDLMGPADAQELFDLDQDVEVMRYINGGTMTTMQEVYDVFLPRMAKYTDQEKGWGLWKITVNETNEFIGWILVRPMGFFSGDPQWKDWELGWRFMRKAWGKGYGTEAAKHVMQSLAKSQEMNYFSAIAMPDNDASIGIMKKLGMKYITTKINKDPLGDLEAVYYQVKVDEI